MIGRVCLPVLDERLPQEWVDKFERAKSAGRLICTGPAFKVHSRYIPCPNYIYIVQTSSILSIVFN